MVDRSPYALSDSENERIFQRYILPVVLPASLGRAASPEAIILGGQPGSGKTALLTHATEELWSRGPTVVVVGDELRSFHPQYAQLQRLEPLKAAAFTDGDSGRWVEKVIAAAQERGVNVVIESTMRRPEVFEKTAQDLREAGYRVEARALAVNERVSWQGVHARFEAMIAAADAPRFTTRESHDAGARGVVETLSQIETRGLADRVAIAGRGGHLLYDNELVDGRWRDPPAAARALTAERSRPRTVDEINRHEAGWQTIVAQMAARAAPAVERERVLAQAIEDRTYFTELNQSWSTRMPQDLSPNEKAILPAARTPDVSSEDLAKTAIASVLASQGRDAIVHLAKKIHGPGREQEVEQTTQAILQQIGRDPEPAKRGQRVAADLVAYPATLAELPGRPQTFLRGGSAEYKEAVGKIPRLAAGFEEYGSIIAAERDRATWQASVTRRRSSVEIPQPSKELNAAFRDHSHLISNPRAIAELERLHDATVVRLSTPEREALSKGEVSRAARSIGISEEHASQLKAVLDAVKGAREFVRMQQQDRSLTRPTMGFSR